MDKLQELRPYQKSLVEFINASLREFQSVAIEAPTGSGKTITGLTAAIEFSKKENRKILYLTRTNSQQEQVLKELRNLSATMNIKAVPLQGRHNLCPLYREFDDDGEFSSESLSRFCNSRKRKVREGDKEACRFFNDRVTSRENLERLFREIPSAEDSMQYGIDNEVCPYESLKFAAAKADIVIAPYAFFLNYDVAERFLMRWGVSRKDLVIVMDEAHNLPDLAREMSSYSITMQNINMAEKEAQEFGDAELSERYRATDFCETLRNGVLDLTRDFLEERDETRIRFGDLVEYSSIGSKINMDSFWSYSSLFALFGEFISQKKEDAGKVPRSHVLSLANKILKWQDSEDQRYVAILSKENSGKVEAFCMEPTAILEPIKISKSIHMSGTLEPFQIYKNITGFNEMPSRKLGSIFPEENRTVLYFDDISTKFEEFNDAEAAKLRDLIESILMQVEKKSLVFFTSYNLMERVCKLGLRTPYLAETKGTSQQDLMALLSKFRSGKKPLFAVMGGRISEGMNFPGEELQLVVLVGIPYPRPDAKQKSLQAYYEAVYRNGWEYAVTFPVLVRMRQAIGRLIRSSSDVGAAVILDKRASYFKSYIPEMKLSRDPVVDLKKFFAGKML
ncbi:MAG: ATP-dependent DNA helicase [Candidatus Thermoplasmatota archaeon]|nr:ATP-dependent DNA helicase [Candidatus Thermoplasmatota archaeon]